MAGAILGFAPLHPPFAQFLPAYMSACSGRLYPTLHAHCLACKIRTNTTIGVRRRAGVSTLLAKKWVTSDENS